MPSQLHPLEVNPTTGEPFLRLKSHNNIILTPPRLSDIAILPEYFNDSRVYGWLSSPPQPYLPEHAEQWIAKSKGETDNVLSALAAAETSEQLLTVDQVPVRAIREVREDGTEAFIGDMGILRTPYGELMGSEVDWEKKAGREKENATLPVGDPNIVWSIGFYLAPSHHGKGIMSDVLATVLHDWAIPRMCVRRLLCNVFVGNEGSMGVFRKNGFVLTRTIENHVEARGEKRSIHVYEWNA
ncbi:acyl-CoA N-acyltransferase [Pluteus cervinus]|uniref:Acyl-CoA N-acyltransferase n=1 Tax=Pluteus cervinus TaxID=181527 RepID=A0ACD3BHV6_9AGAR|nr:acyl-CoA N-acyltransferase [Pluteus cervinus]